MHNWGSMFIRSLLFGLLFWCSYAHGAIVVRQHSATIQPNLKILASDLNDEFNNLVTGVNTINSANVVNGSLTAVNMAATSSAVSIDKKNGCAYQGAADITGNKLVQILPPCEIFMDGVRGYITATQSISLLSNLADGAVATANFYYIYATMNSGSLGFQFSQTGPSLATNRKSGSTTARYIGLVRTADATQDISSFTQRGPEIIWSRGDSTTPSVGVTFRPTKVSAAYTVSVPFHINDVLLQYSAYVSGFPAQCKFDVSSIRSPLQAIVVATGGHVGISPEWTGLSSVGATRSLSLDYVNISNCIIGGDLVVTGIREPASLHY